ncbi:MAG: hypothetical protein Q8K63_13610, partial [Acidimicrobiales bacterium]|nr:hypothetical protein [Acidimicrobiales bacterium]
QHGSSGALDRRHRDILGVISAVLLLGGLFGVVMQGMGTAPVVAAHAARDLDDVELRPEVKDQVVEAAPTPAAPVTAAPTTANPAPPKFATQTFRASFPIAPKPMRMSRDIDGIKVELTYYATDQPAISYGVGIIPIPPRASVDLERAAQGSALGGGGTISSTMPTTFRNYRALQATITVDGGMVYELIVRTPSHIVMILVAGDGDPIKEFFNFRDSVELLV